jgi:hypothetical protein
MSRIGWIWVSATALGWSVLATCEFLWRHDALIGGMGLMGSVAWGMVLILEIMKRDL